MQSEIKKYNESQEPVDEAICDFLARTIDEVLVDAESKIWHAHPVWFLNVNPIVAGSVTFSGMLNASFNQIRQYSEGSPSVVIRLMEALITINQIVINTSHKKALGKHAKMVFNTAQRTFKEEQDLKDLEVRYQKLNDNS
ncbi:MAG: hypothetical protein RIF39_11685 [Cyclobacteriaceae bacterium]